MVKTLQTVCGLRISKLKLAWRNLYDITEHRPVGRRQRQIRGRQHAKTKAGHVSEGELFLGGILSISSTTIIIRAFDETGVKMRSFARLVFGILIVEDLVAILLLVLLSTIGISRQFQGRELVGPCCAWASLSSSGL